MSPIVFAVLLLVVAAVPVVFAGIDEVSNKALAVIPFWITSSCLLFYALLVDSYAYHV